MKKTMVCFVVMVALVVSNVARADQTAPAPKKAAVCCHEGFNIFKTFRKGGRGLINIVTSPFEIPNQMVKEAKRHQTVGGDLAGYVSGIPIGCGWMLYRCGTGIVDVVTGPIPMPTYEHSCIHPEFLFPEDPYVAE